ncbi:MAG: PilZ domain-containing protein [Myxococcota bacterium]|nr:PilZ domain-containing protein [Myxococcales bacterium]
MSSDRRKYPRIATDQVISFAMLDDRDRLAVGRDLSTGGIRFETVGCELEVGETLRVTFNVDDETVVAVGRVVWATDVDAITTDIGLEFIDIHPRGLELLQAAIEAHDEVEGSGQTPFPSA